jgi:hypothetical protein
LDEVSGTLGLAGSVDTVVALKRARTQGEATLSVTGRDVEEMVYAVTFKEGKWYANGTTLAEAARKAGESRLGEKMRAVLDLVNERTTTTPSDVVRILGEKEATARQCLSRLANAHNMISRIGMGVYAPVTVSQVSQAGADCGLDGSDVQSTTIPAVSQSVPSERLVLAGSLE